MPLPILLVEDDIALREALQDTLELDGQRCVAVADGKEAVLALQRRAFALVLSDINMPAMDGQQLLQHVVRHAPGVPVILMTAYGDVQGAVQAMRHGAADYLLKPFTSKELLKVLRPYLAGSAMQADEQPVAEDPASIQLLALAARVAQSDATVLLTGESGTGKEVLARYIHQQSKYKDGPFVAINCAAIPENMLEATLFGHEKGAFTGAVAARPGKFEQANGGTLLLDEISEMPLELQAKLLRVLQELEVERVGGRVTIELDVRVIATSNRDLPASVAQGKFREDLYYRLAVFPLAWLPLRERPLDIVPIAQRMLAKHAAKQGRAGVEFSAAACQALQQHQWPGNVRELDNVVQRALILQQGNSIQPQDLGIDVLALSDFASAAPVVSAEPVQSCPEPETELAEVSDLEMDTKLHEFRLIAKALELEGGQRQATAERLGISPRTLRYKLAQMRELGMAFP